MRVKSLRELASVVREDLEAHRGEWARPGFQALAVHRLGTWRQSVAWAVVRKPCSAVYYAAAAFCRNVYAVEIGEGAHIGRRVVIEHQGIVVHGNSVVGDGCVLRQGVTLGCKTPRRAGEAPRLGRDVQVGANAVIVGNITVGDGTRIGACSVVSQDLPAGARAFSLMLTRHEGGQP